MNHDGFASFFHQRYGKTVVMLIAMGASRADAEDAVQEVMIQAWRQWDSIREPAAWVRTTAARTCWKRASKERHVTASLDEADPQPVTHDPDLAIFAEEQEQVLSALQGLPAQQRKVAALFYDGMTAEEIAVLTAKPPATVRSHLRHARKTLKEVIVSDRNNFPSASHL